LLKTQDFDGSATVFEDVVARVPNHTDAHIALEVAYAGANRISETIEECKKVLAVVPDHYPSNLTLGVFLARSGQFDAALANLQKAAALKPEAPQPHRILAAVYAHLGRDADAERERAEAKRLLAKPSQPANAAPDSIPNSADQN